MARRSYTLVLAVQAVLYVACGDGGGVDVDVDVHCEATVAGLSAPPSYDVTALAIDPDRSMLWIGTSDGAVGVDLASSAQTRFTTVDSGLASNRIAAVAVDDDGDVWFGHGDESCGGGGCGVARYTPVPDGWRTFRAGENNLVDGRINSLALSPTGAVWAGTFSGAAFIGADNWGTWFDFHDCYSPGTHCSPLWSYVVKDLALASDGTGWFAVDLMVIGTQPKPGGVARLTADGLTDTWDMDDGLASNQAQCVALDGDRVWAGSRDGVMVLDPGDDRFAMASEHAAGDIAVGSSVVWVASEAGAVARKSSGGTWTSFKDDNCLLARPVNALLAFDDTICFGTPSGAACYHHDTTSWSYPYWFE